jgi:ABC-type transport system involved in cytochrome bd biosynthesis fused ATPase/permease subunit
VRKPLFLKGLSTVDNLILGLFSNRYALACFGILFIQQIIEASSTIWLVKLMQAITQGQAFTTYFILSIASLALAYIPQCIAYIFKITWKQEAIRSFINTFISANKNNILEWSDKKVKEKKLSILTSEAPTVLHGSIDYAWDLYTYILSVFLNMTALSVVLEPLFILTYGLSVLCVFVVMKFKRETQMFMTQKALSSRVDLVQSLLAAWDNVLLGNEYSFKLWEDKTNQRLARCMRRNVELERFDQFLAIIVSLITSIPSLLVVIFHVVQHRNNPVELSSFIVVLPLLFMNLSYTYQTLSLAFRWNMHRGKLHSVYKAIQSGDQSSTLIENKVNWPKIAVSEKKYNEACDPQCNPTSHLSHYSIQSHNDLLAKASTSCRLTLRGDNGCGKSATLMLMKQSLEDRAFFLPTQNQLSFLAESHKHSTGESLKKRLGEILEKVEVDVLLLDEWDANLDKENEEQLSNLIDKMAEKKCIIEVRHR